MILKFMAQACHYAQEHIDDKYAWSIDRRTREDRLQCVSYQMACFFAQNTVRGDEGVDWDIVMFDLATHPMKSEAEWEKILDEIVTELGGWKEGAR